MSEAKKRKTHTPDFKAKVGLEALRGVKTINQIAQDYPLTEAQKASNRIKSKTRVRVEHVFGAQHTMGGHIVRTIGLARAKVKIGMMNLVYNMKRLGQLLKRDVQTTLAASTPHGTGASIAV